MHDRTKILTCRADWMKTLAGVFLLLAAGAGPGAAAVAQQAAQPAPLPSANSTSEAQTAAPAAEAGHSRTSGMPPVAIVAIDPAVKGAALSVSGEMQARGGRAYLTGSGTIIAGTATAQVTLPYRGTLRVCTTSTVKLAADTSTPAGEVPGLLIALDHGAVEMSFAASAARARNADTLLTPFFRILIGGPNPAEVKVRLGEHGDTCVDNANANAPYVVVSSVFEGGVYRVQAGQRVMFEHGSLHEVVDQEKEPCGCPPPESTTTNEFPLAQSAGLTPAATSAPVASGTPGAAPNASGSLVYNGADHAAQAEAPGATPGTQSEAAQGQAAGKAAPGAAKKKGFFGRIGGFFRKIFGAE